MIMLFLWLDFFSFLFFSFFFVFAPTAESDELDYLFIEGRDCVRGGPATSTVPRGYRSGFWGAVFKSAFTGGLSPGRVELRCAQRIQLARNVGCPCVVWQARGFVGRLALSSTPNSVRRLSFCLFRRIREQLTRTT
jgi:hypothetical protein